MKDEKESAIYVVEGKKFNFWFEIISDFFLMSSNFFKFS